MVPITAPVHVHRCENGRKAEHVTPALSVRKLESDDVGVFQRLGGAGIRRFRPRGGHQNTLFRGQDYMIPYMVGKLAPNPTHSTRGLVKYVPGRGYFRAIPSQNGDKTVTSPPPSIVERVVESQNPDHKG